MNQSIFSMEYAGHPVYYKLYYPATRYQFHPWLKKTVGCDYDIAVTTEMLEQARMILPDESSDAFVEYRVLIALTAKVLLRYDCCIFHCVSFVWQGFAWLLAAPSGTGKTTQYYNWIRLHPEEIIMISGDMPVLERRKDGSIWAHSTSWNGKENIGNSICAPVAGIVFLKQEKVNYIERMSASNAISSFFAQFMVRPETEEEIFALARLIDQILQNIPVWEMANRGDSVSTEMLRKTFEEQLNNH